MKKCTRCKIKKPLSEFSLRRNKKGLKIWITSACRKCMSKLTATWVKDNKNRFNEYQRWWKLKHRDELAEYKREWRKRQKQHG